ncbi:MAG: alpha-L-rhamnosidase [Clostridia bacterium]|nr:alpha-L-rhamnosidase [Clostridia bacterium]
MTDQKIREYLLPERILWQRGEVMNAEYLLKYHTDQSFFGGDIGCILQSGSAVLLDFGQELSGGVKLVCNECSGNKNARLGITFGESAMEALSALGHKGACNDHAIRHEEVTVPWVGSVEFGNTGFRFVKIENVSPYAVSLRQAFALFVHSNVTATGTFCCSDERLNRIWDAGAYTVFLNMQDYVYDGIKRDRVVWIGDMHPETSAILRLYGKDERVERSLELVKNNTPSSEWMNAIPTYSMWWIKIVADYYLFTGDREFALRQLDYVRSTALKIAGCVLQDGTIDVADRFIDWPSSKNPEAQEAGVRSLLHIALKSALYLSEEVGEKPEKDWEVVCQQAIGRLSLKKSCNGKNKQAAALLAFSGLCDAEKINREQLSVDPYRGISTFLGYYVLLCRGMAHDVTGALDVIRRYWGAMLDLGATTFWEDFDLNWADGAKPIDSILRADEYDVHGDNGSYCYSGYRHSLCHGWAAGPVPFLSEYVLGVRVKEAGCKKLEIVPDLGDLTWAEGTFPTPYGTVRIRHERINGKVHTQVDAPKGIEYTVTLQERKTEQYF